MNKHFAFTCRADNQQTVDLDSPAENEIDTERYADLDYSREGELSHLAGWFDPHAADLEGMFRLHCLSVQLISLPGISEQADNQCIEACALDRTP